MSDFIGDEDCGPTHHFACDCREEKFRKLEEENKRLNELVFAYESTGYPVNPLLKENKELRLALKANKPANAAYEAENKELRAIIERFRACNGAYDLEMLRQALKKEKDEREFTDYNI
jgi:hypothetical protein